MAELSKNESHKQKLRSARMVMDIGNIQSSCKLKKILEENVKNQLAVIKEGSKKMKVEKVEHSASNKSMRSLEKR